MENTYQHQHDELHFKITTAISEFERATGGKVKRIAYARGVCDVDTTLTPPLPPQQALIKEAIRRLDFLDEKIDTLEREKQAAGDDLSIIDQVKHEQQKAREYLSRGDIGRAWWEIHYTEFTVGLGLQEIARCRELFEAIKDALSS